MDKLTIRDFDGQATFGHHTGFTYTNPNYPFKRLRDVIRAEGEEVLHTKEEVELIRQEALLVDCCGAVASRLEAAMDFSAASRQSHL